MRSGEWKRGRGVVIGVPRYCPHIGRLAPPSEEDMTTTNQEQLAVGDYVEDGEGEDHDFGTVVAVEDGDHVTIAWDGSVQRTTMIADASIRITRERYRALRAAM